MKKMNRQVVFLLLFLPAAVVVGQEMDETDTLQQQVIVPAKKKKKSKKIKAIAVPADTAAVRETKPEDPCSQGIAQARKDMATGDYWLLYRNMPFSKEVQEILFEDYHIRVVENSSLDVAYCRCYTDEMTALLTRHFGVSVVSAAEEKAKINASRSLPADTITTEKGGLP